MLRENSAQLESSTGFDATMSKSSSLKKSMTKKTTLKAMQPGKYASVFGDFDNVLFLAR